MLLQTHRPGRCATTLAAALLLSGVATFIPVGGPAEAGAPSGVAAPAANASLLPGLRQYALNDHELATVRGGFALPNGIDFSFGFRQITRLNGTLVQSILVPQVSNLAKPIPVFVVGGTVTVASASSPSGSPAGTPTGTPTVTSAGTIANPPNSLPVIVNTGSAPDHAGGNSGQAYAGNEYQVPLANSAITVSTTVSGSQAEGATAIRTTLGANGVFSGISNTLSNQAITQATEMDITLSGLAASVAAAQAIQRVINTVTAGIRIPEHPNDEFVQPSAPRSREAAIEEDHRLMTRLWTYARRHVAAHFRLASVTLVVAAGLLLPMAAANAGNTRANAQLIAALDGVTPLPADALANESARGAAIPPSPQFRANAPPVTLWDDLGPPLAPAIGRTTVTISGGPGGQ